jgi:folate-binding protein YgfZ
MSQQHFLNQLTVFELTGKDTFDFLNNQIISQLSENDGICYTAICNPKGRILFSLIVSPSKNGCKLAVNGDLSDNFFHYVNMRRFRMEVSIEKSNLKVCIDMSNGSSAHLDHFNFIEPKNNANIFSDDDFWTLMFEMGLPWITATTSECFIPQHLNLDQKDVIAFDKGCYPGQEIIARLHFIGKVKKRMEVITLINDTDVKPGETKFLEELNQKVEFCSPLVKSPKGWQAQVIK